MDKIRISSLFKNYKKQIFIYYILDIIKTIIFCLIPLILSKIIDSGIKTQNMDVILKNGLLLILASFLTLGITIVLKFIASNTSKSITKDIQNKTFEKVNSLSVLDIESFTSSSIVTRITNDAAKIGNIVTMILTFGINIPLSFFFAFFMAFRINGSLAKITLTVLPFMILTAGIIAYFATPIFTSIQKIIDRINRLISENIKGIRTVKTYTQEGFEQKKFEKENLNIKNGLMKIVVFFNLIEPFFSLFIGIVTILLLHYGGQAILKDEIHPGDFVALIFYISQIFRAVISSVFALIASITGIASFKRINEILKTKNGIEEKETPIKKMKKYNIEFKNVSFKYPDDMQEKVDKSKNNKVKGKEKVDEPPMQKNKEYEYTLKDISFKIPEGHSLGIFGLTGSGKSTIASLLNRFYDVTDGDILIGDVNIKDYSLGTITSNISYIEQKNKLFKGSIRSNLLIGKQKATDEELKLSLKKAQAYDFVSSYPDFLDHEVLTDGANFSGGQKQRLCIARALLKKANIIIIDDSTSALDYETERNIQKALFNKDNTTTKIIISQRISSFKHCDEILVLDKGQIISQGSHDYLLNNCPLYTEIYNSQGGNNENK